MFSAGIQAEPVCKERGTMCNRIFNPVTTSTPKKRKLQSCGGEDDSDTDVSLYEPSFEEPESPTK